MYTKINKPKAKKLYEDGKMVILTSKKYSPASMFAIRIIKGMMGADDFEALVNAFRYYHGSVSYWVA